MILSCQNISKSFVENKILNPVSFHIQEQEKAAVIGINGAGKSTLLKIITGETAPDEGSVIIAKDTEVGYLAQHQDLHSDRTILGEVKHVKKHILDAEREMRSLEFSMESASGDELDRMLKQYTALSREFEEGEGYKVRSEVTGVLKGLGFEESEFERTVNSLSGGQKTRLALARLLLLEPDLLLLDEPTNHLDLKSVAWLENYLRSYRGAVLIVTHDRYFLDHTVTKVIEIENGQARSYNGTYSDYAKQKAMIRQARMREYLSQQQEIRHQEEVITKLRSFNREKSVKRADSREKALSKIERVEKPQDIDDEMRLHLEPALLSGKDVLTVTNLSKAFPGRVLFDNLSFQIKRGEHVAVIGDNGTGKTTLLKIINEQTKADRGEVVIGTGVMIGYYDQEHQVLHSEKTLFDEIHDEHPDMDNTRVRSTLAAFLFSGDDVFKKISDLSGGEQGRVSLARLMLSEANFLILDEPTNHLDMVSREILEEALNNYSGTVLFVSHDRYFINKTAQRILELSGSTFTEYIGNYDYFLEKKSELDESAEASDKPVESEASIAWKNQKEEQSRIRRRAHRIDETENKIESLENRDSEIDRLLCLPENASDPEAYIKFAEEKKEIAKQLDTLYLEWEKLQEE